MIGGVASPSAKLSKTLGTRLMLSTRAKPCDRADFDVANLADAALQPLP
jgi:hypothetical protein